MSLVQSIKEAAARAIQQLYGHSIQPAEVLINQTKPEFEGDYTIVLFALVKPLRKSPEQLGQELGALLVQDQALFTGFNVIKGFLNLVISDAALKEAATQPPALEAFGGGRKVMIEYSSPNTNKPLHLGHLRNNFLGWSVAQLLKATGHEVMKSCIVNDRGIHICKSMLAWQKYANGATPESTGIKGDHFVGDYYVKFENELKQQAAPLTQELLQGNFSTLPEAEAKKAAAIFQAYEKEGNKQSEAAVKAAEAMKEIARANTTAMREARQMLVDWEAGKPEVMQLWEQMNGWVYEGFDATYRRIGSDFDTTYYESKTYLLGRSLVEKGLDKGVFFRKEDGSVWIDLTEEGLDEKLVLRKDGTSVYITQDLGLAEQKYELFPYDQSFYVIADEQIYHMKVLQLILKKLGMPYADGIQHLSYGMVELPTGRMKSREGTVVDADDLVDVMVKEAAARTAEKSKVDEFSQEELSALYETIALGALKFFLLKVDPKKKMIFNPEESIDFQGFTGPFIQYTHARLKSILRKAEAEGMATTSETTNSPLLPLEKALLLQLEQYAETVFEAARAHSPAVIANYVYAVAKTFNSFYTEHSVLKAESEEKRQLRLGLCRQTADVLREGMQLLGIRVPERM
jgi:arginyl-tRNA synthetase